MATIHDQMKALQQHIARLEKSDDMLLLIQSKAKTEGGRLTQFGKDIVLTCHNNNLKVGEIAKILDVTPSAITQNIAKYGGVIDNSSTSKEKS